MEQTKKTKERLFPSTRLAVTLLWFYGAITFYVVRNNFGVSIVCMTIDPIENDTSYNVTTSIMVDEQCEEVSHSGYETGEFYWDRTTRGILNSGFFIGYLVTNFFGGIIAHKLGAKWVHFGGMVLATAACVLCPVSAEGSEWALMTMRIILGLGCGTFVPTITEIVNSWSPAQEKSRLYSIYSSGAPIGSVIAFSMSGALCDNLGWEYTFYIPAIFSAVYVVLVAFLVSNGPEHFKCIPASEKEFILKERGHKSKENLTIPWGCIFSSIPCWSIFICNFCVAWGSHTIITSGAQYMNDVLKFDIQSNGLYNALPQLCKFIITLFAGYLVDIIQRRKWLSTTNTCKLVQTLAMPVQAAMMIGMGFMTCSNRDAAIAMLCLGEGFGGFNLGVPISMMSMAPRLVPVIVGVGNSFSQIAGMLAPIVAGTLTPEGSEEEWRIVFIIGACIYMVGWLAFILFATTEPQPWGSVTAVHQDIIVDATQTKNSDTIYHSQSSIVGISYASHGKLNEGFSDENGVKASVFIIGDVVKVPEFGSENDFKASVSVTDDVVKVPEFSVENDLKASVTVTDENDLQAPACITNDVAKLPGFSGEYDLKESECVTDENDVEESINNTDAHTKL